jgi:hypothetical protein
MPFDPTLPAASTQISSAELRAQFNGLKDLIDALPRIQDVDAEIASLTPAPVDSVATLTPDRVRRRSLMETRKSAFIER